ncbi:MAG: helix-turn-helix transcriptional regulator [Chloroflexi bacterium]|nr:helix-turn-helix transcriptional regulator [Chloroflexota bacterium]
MLLAANAPKVELTAKLFRGFADSSRLAILETLRGGALTVGEIVAATEFSQSNVSNHLSCLRDCGLVSTMQEGRFVFYELSDKRVAGFLQMADELLSEVARGVYECVHYQKPKRALVVRNVRRNVPSARRNVPSARRNVPVARRNDSFVRSPSRKERNGVRSVQRKGPATRRNGK